jgi:GNAT superfamily N-acetyltransferase
MEVNSPVPIDRSHDTASFDCGVAPLNEYLKKYALLNHQNRSARTYVAMRGSRLVGYYTLAAGSVSRSEVPPRVAQGLGQYPVPITLLARLAVDDSEKGKGLGRGLLKDAVLRALQASEIVGSRAIVTHAKDEAAKAFYQKFNFVASPINELHLYLLMKDIQAIFGHAMSLNSGLQSLSKRSRDLS